MKIAFYVPTLNLGGYEKVVLNYANHFSLNHEIMLVCGKAVGNMKEEISSRVQVVDLNVRARSLLPALCKWMKKNRDVNIFYVPFATYTTLAVFAKKWTRSKTIIYGAQHGFEQNNSILFSIIKRLVAQADVLAAVSKAVAQHESKRFNIPVERYNILDNPVFTSLSEIPFVDLNFNTDGAPILVTSGRLAVDKHIEIPIKIVAELNKYMKVNLLILGDGPEKDNLQALVSDLGINSFVHFAGYVQNPMSYFMQCDIYMQTSEIESFGNGVIEAQLCNLPAIVTDCGGPVDLIRDGDFGINIGAYNSKNVIQNGVQAVKAILNGEKEFGLLSENAKKYDVVNLEKQFLAPYYSLQAKIRR